MKISLESLLQHLVNGGTKAARNSMPTIAAPAAPTSIRLKPTTKHFLDCQANALNTSTQSLISMILDGVAEDTLNSTSETLRLIRERFFRIFEAHQLDLPSIISVMDEHGFTLSTLDNPTQILDLLNQKSIQHLSQTFFVRPEWIRGSPNSGIGLSTNVGWYKHTHTAADKLLQYAKQGLNPHVMFIRREKADFAAAKEDNDNGLTIREPIGVVIRLSRVTNDGVRFTVYDVWQFERWNYWRCREQIKLLITFCDQAHRLISYSGYELNDEDIKSLMSHSVMPIGIISTIHLATWFPDDYACLRDKVTKEIDEWPLIKEQYEKSNYDQKINEALMGNPII